MLLSDRDIKRALASGRIKITPALDLSTQLGSCSIDLRLGTTFRVFEHSRHPYIDTKRQVDLGELMREVVLGPDDPLIMQPREFVLAVTHESIELAADIVARLEGRSSLARLGIIVHGTSSVFDPGWRGNATLELGNLGIMPVALYPGMKICSFTFEPLSSECEVPYHLKQGQKYSGQTKPEASRLAEEFRRP